MLKTIKPESEPIKSGESWWIVHPNNGNAEFVVPSGAITVCIKQFDVFEKNIAYSIVGDDSSAGWITLATTKDIVKMPYYVFARYFDAEAFVRNSPTKRHYSPKQLELFEG